MTQLDLTAWTPPDRVSVPRDNPNRPSIEERWAAWSATNGHVLAELLRLARAHLDRGVSYLSVKKLWEECRVSLSAREEGGYRLNNDFTASAGRWLIEAEPQLEHVIRTRRTKR